MNYARLYSFAYTLLKDEAAAHDAVHDVFANLLHTCNDVEICDSYLMRCVRNRCLNIIRDMPVKVSVENLVMTEHGIDSFYGTDCNDEDTLAMIHLIINESLPQQCSRVMLLRYESGLSYSDIAQQLGISKAAVYKHLKNGLEQIRKKLISNK